MYSFAQRQDTTIVDEPFYAAYLKASGIIHPGLEEILDAQETDYTKVLRQVILKEYDSSYVFFKQMSHHLREKDLNFILPDINIILIRPPKNMITSFAKVIDNPNINDLGLKDSYHIYKYLDDNGKNCTVINSAKLLEDPSKYIKNLCEAIDIEFEPQMLTWKSGARKEDGVWAKYWYKNVHQSNGFTAHVHQEPELDQRFESLYQECLYFYNELNQHAI